MLSVFHQGAAPPCPTPFNLAAYVLAKGAQTPDKVALSILGPTGADRWRYARLIGAMRGTATGLLETGLTAGDKVLMRLGNTVEFPIAYLACIAVGIVPVPTSSQLTEGEVQKVIDVINPAAILVGDAIACPETHCPIISEAALLKMRDLPPADWQLGDPNRAAYIVFTSGTSGTPRAVVHAHRAIWARRMMHEGWYGLTAEDRLCHAGAFNWTYTLGTGLMDPWSVGATALIPEPGLDPAQMALLLKRHEATIFAAAPGVYRQLLKHADALKMPHLRHGLSAGEKLSPKLRERWMEATGTTVYEAYGMSECSTFVSSSPAHPVSAGALGRPQIGRHVAIRDETGPVPIGEPGTIAVHKSDPGLMLEYLGAPEDTAARFNGDWFMTGDQASMAENGEITFLGRADDMMNAGGFRVSPLEVEAALNQHPEITQCAVTDIEVKEDARLIMAFYAAPTPLDEAELSAFATKHLARYKCPRGFFHLDALPTGPNGKLSRRALRPIYEDLIRET